MTEDLRDATYRLAEELELGGPPTDDQLVRAFYSLLYSATVPAIHEAADILGCPAASLLVQR